LSRVEATHRIGSPLTGSVAPVPVRLVDAPARAPRPGIYQRFLKPVADRVGGLVLTVGTLPLMVVIAAVILAVDGRPFLFVQERVGLGGRRIRVYKFRTMVPDRRQQAAPIEFADRRRVHKSPEDPRVTPLGRFLRKWSLDELPQFWNVLRGDMSLVGPRPELPEIVDSKYEAWYHRRHDVRPGLTGLWQVSRRSAGQLMHECCDVDLEYVDTVSFRTDLTILLKTIPAAIHSAKGH
jgi:lipopolysaccharide/colanic/teichoic acid biosynthesis glycosyltransferase